MRVGGRFGFPKLVPSQLVNDYVMMTKTHYNKIAKPMQAMLAKLNPPYVIGFRFIRDSRRKFDYSNALDTVQDMLTGQLSGINPIITDDNSDILLPVLLPTKYDKYNAGVEIHILPYSADEYQNRLI